MTGDESLRLPRAPIGEPWSSKDSRVLFGVPIGIWRVESEMGIVPGNQMDLVDSAIRFLADSWICQRNECDNMVRRLSVVPQSCN